MVCMGDGVENKFVVVHGKANGWWELRGFIRQDEIGDMGHFVPMKKDVY